MSKNLEKFLRFVLRKLQNRYPNATDCGFFSFLSALNVLQINTQQCKMASFHLINRARSCGNLPIKFEKFHKWRSSFQGGGQHNHPLTLLLK